MPTMILLRPWEGKPAGERIDVDDHTADALLAAGRAELTEKRASRPAEPKPEPEAPAKPAGRGRKTNPA